MKKRFDILSKSMTGLLTAAMIASTVPVFPVFAEDTSEMELLDDGDLLEYDESFEGEYLDIVEEDLEECTVFVVTKYVDFEKDEEGHFKDSETKEKYGDLKAEPGTALNQLGLPEDLDVEGYWEADGPECISTLSLEDITWELDSDSGEEYSEFSEAGKYTFVPDFDEYVLNDDFLTEIKRAEDVKKLKIDVTIEEKETETPETAEEAFEEEAFEGEPAFDDGIVISDDSSDAGESVDESSSNEEVSIEDIDSPELLPAESSIEEENTDDIFNNIDDSLLNPVSEESYNVEDASETEPDNTVSVDELAPIENVENIDSTDSNEIIIIEETENSDAEQFNDDPPEEKEPTAEAEPTEKTLEALITLTDVNGVAGTTPSPVILKTDADYNEVTLSGLPCNMNLSSVTVSVNGTIYASSCDFNSSNPQDIKITVAENESYTIRLTVSQNVHAWSQATCQQKSTCANCGAVTGDYAAHTSSGKASCTSYDICSVCGKEFGEMKGHTWKEATCTTPKTCTTCGTTEGNALGHSSSNNATCTKNATCSVCKAEIPDTKLGHDWEPATCTEPKTCNRCSATEGKALGHDLGDWEVVTKSTDSKHGEKERICMRDYCDYSETQTLNIIADPANNYISGLEEGADYSLNTRIEFTAVGAGTANSSPIKGDVRYIPSTWSIQGTPGTFSNGYTGAFSVTKKGTYTVTVTYQKQTYDGSNWCSTDIADSKTATFTVGGSSDTGNDSAVRINPKTGDDTPIVPIVGTLGAALLAIIGLVVYKKKR